MTQPAPDARAIRIHRSLAAAEADWRAAEASLVHYGFQRFDWLSAWQDTIGDAAGIRPVIVVVADAAGRPEMLLPLGLLRRRGLTTLLLPGAPVTDYRGPMLRADFDATGFEALWRRILAALPRFDVMRLDRMPAMVEGVPNPLAALPGARATERAWSTKLPGSLEAYWATRRRSFQGDTRRKRRKLAEQGPLHFEVARDPAAMAEVLAVMKAEKSRRWAETGNPDGFADPAMAAFYHRATERLGEAAHGCLLRVGGEPVAAHWGMIHAGRFYYLMIGSRVGEWARFSVGRLLVEDMIGDAVARGLRVFDLTVGDEEYKRHWADDEMPLLAIRGAGSAAGRLALLAERGWEGLRERARRATWLRRLIRRPGGRAGAPGGGPAGRAGPEPAA